MGYAHHDVAPNIASGIYTDLHYFTARIFCIMQKSRVFRKDEKYARKPATIEIRFYLCGGCFYSHTRLMP